MIAHSNAPWTPHYARHFRSAGHEVFLLSFHPDLLDGVPMAFVGKLPFRMDSNKGMFIQRVPRVRKLLRQFAPDVVLATYLVSNGLTAALGWRGPLVVSARGSDVLTSAGRPGGFAFLQPRILRFVCRRATFVHAVSEELSEKIESLGVPRDRIACFPVGVDLNRFRFEQRPTTGEPHIICTRKHEPLYQNEVLIDALAILRDRGRSFRCTLIGDGVLREALERKAAELHLTDRVTFTRTVDHDRMPGLLAGEDVYVSAAASDGTSASLLEAMASGLFPVVTRIRGNLPWVQDGDNGFLFSVGNSGELTAR